MDIIRNILRKNNIVFNNVKKMYPPCGREFCYCIKTTNLNEKKMTKLVQDSNKRLNKIRKKTKDLILSPFKGNNKSGNRRRRLDYRLARGIIEKSIIKGEKGRMAELVDA